MMGRRSRLVPLIVLALAATAACSPAPSQSPLAARDLADAPPAAVQTWLAQIEMPFRPLTGPERALVRAGSATAKQTALVQPPAQYGNSGGKIVWTKVGCVFLGYYTPYEPRHLGPTPDPSSYPAYLVQVIGAAVPGFPGYNIQVVFVDAETAQVDGIISNGGPLLGTTCGVLP